MKTSELIKELQDIDKTVPLTQIQSQVDDWVSSNYSEFIINPPHTFLEFDTQHDSNLTDEAFFEKILENYKNSIITKQDAIQSLVRIYGRVNLINIYLICLKQTGLAIYYGF